MNYTSELKTVRNTLTDVTRYYMMVCGVWRRISRAEYEEREGYYIDACNLFAQIKKHVVINTKTIHGTY